MNYEGDLLKWYANVCGTIGKLRYTYLLKIIFATRTMCMDGLAHINSASIMNYNFTLDCY